MASRAHGSILRGNFKGSAGKESVCTDTIRKVSIAQYNSNILVVIIIFHLTAQCEQCLSFPQCRALAYFHGLELELVAVR